MTELWLAEQRFDADLVIFDKDGALIDFGYYWGERTHNCVEHLLAQVSADANMRADLFRTLGYDPGTGSTAGDGPLATATMAKLYNIATVVLYQHGFGWDEAEALAQRHFASCMGAAPTAELVKPLGDVPGLFSRLAQAGVKIAIVTSDDHERQCVQWTFGVSLYVSEVVGGDDDLPMKPAPDALLQGCKRLGVSPQRAMMVGDTVADLVMTERAGAGFRLGVLSGVSNRDELSPHADLILDPSTQFRIMALSAFWSGKDYKHFQMGAHLLEHALAKDNVPQRVPVYAQLHEFVMKELGITAKEFYTTPELMIYGALEITEKYGIDVPYADYDVYNIEAEALGQALVWHDDFMPDVDRRKPLISGPEDLSKIVTPDFTANGRCTEIIEVFQIFQDATGIQPTLGFCAPFSLAANIRGTENLLMDMLVNPVFARALFERLTEQVLAPWILHQKAHFPDATSIVGSDATASLPIVSPSILSEWVAPFIRRLQDLCGPEIHVPNWVGESFLSDPTPMLDLKLSVSGNYIEGQDPDIAKLGPERYLRYAQKHDVALLLGVGAAFFAQSTPDEVTARVKHYLEVGKQHDRFALFFCNIGATTPPENVIAAVEAVRTYGVYAK